MKPLLFLFLFLLFGCASFGGAVGMKPASGGGLASKFAADQATQFGTPLSLGGQNFAVTGGTGGLSALPVAAGTAIGSAPNAKLRHLPTLRLANCDIT